MATLLMIAAAGLLTMAVLAPPPPAVSKSDRSLKRAMQEYGIDKFLLQRNQHRYPGGDVIHHLQHKRHPTIAANAMGLDQIRAEAANITANAMNFAPAVFRDRRYVFSAPLGSRPNAFALTDLPSALGTEVLFRRHDPGKRVD